MISKLASFISIIFHPLLLTFLLFGIFSVYSPYLIAPVRSALPSFLLIIFVITFLIPLLSISLLRISKSISDIHLADRRERVLPFIFVTIFYLIITLMFLFKLNIGVIFNQIFITTTLIIFTITLITFFWKISVHSTGIAGLLGFLVGFHLKSPQSELMWPILFAVLASGMVMSARLYLNVHRPREVHLGALIGFCFSFFSTIFFG